MPLPKTRQINLTSGPTLTEVTDAVQEGMPQLMTFGTAKGKVRLVEVTQSVSYPDSGYGFCGRLVGSRRQCLVHFNAYDGNGQITIFLTPVRLIQEIELPS